MDAEEILKFWFGDFLDPKVFPMQQAEKWFRVNEDFDQEIRSRFSKKLELASLGMLDDWKENPKGRLALILLLDQFTRNLFREMPEAFANDAKALSLCLDGLSRGMDKELNVIERWFFYMPLMHSENLDYQHKSLECFSKLVQEAPKEVEFAISDAYDFAIKHYELIKRFGRFPHRNDILGRVSTPEEEAFLAGSEIPF